MDSSRITKIEGNFMGVKFVVKPTPLNVNQLEEEQRELLLSWYKEHQRMYGNEMTFLTLPLKRLGIFFARSVSYPRMECEYA